ncbi:3-oxoacyl-[acyl-carrier-protein] synthase 3 [Dinoroseobacter shibae DFL 12 = DSM 16493]|jgi:3-oxoacyl-[acyl-carrier-protein] synthase-3|uniref:Beta-ketoacyl-[acyl-carrier-protein] synthase III n=1 Tax=Dinoroseobacter shibae (strain DSM 16493 / NCIMB 14021 / DFL 12) TaxID=398580 RepID=FABH_DINSH|nr:beta-ketoacyl-ACP synthase III [Dinoroseobacter shibae]A8LLT4.1 RecName: Full=Beta-ketoacyl-[acyl-carrier-protein] synthase III; Short=Beta-ketoacyl-ACP synthase III; Short=KAS III; AltName: Full=3-oxoacyl-[acyl-carrier-protein] synthase 3; AltName: Full=3-oxoacyl-[acyl-carrier-protein] synthase III [Dinoroseobacter shibae DFL 12 = DSM 16493]ABV93462.1 3-oxoacyl-[acyl-carrier-protein] synthase 3 [Dinoroseobacter shibae DFL 12 = DSM 16493]URF48373.1 ketoacyl-ACP synthase III [Dinoroseobacter s
MGKRAVVTGVGHYLPSRVVPNSELETLVDTTDEWIRTRSGIERRHFAADGEQTSDLATAAAQAALDHAELTAQDVDAVIVATSTPDLTFPAVATMVQARLGMTRGFAYDVQAVCAGFVFAMANANAMILSGQADRILVIGAETFSRIMDWTDRSTCVLFGDGAGAVVLEARDGTGGTADRGILSADLNSDGRHRDILYVDGGVSSSQTAGYLRMEGKEVFRHAIEKLAATAETALAKAGLTEADVDWVVPHQANLRIITATARKMGIGMDRVVVTVADHGNTSAASIPMALSVGVARGQIKPGDLVVTEAIGGGLSWGSVVLRW